MADQQQPSRLKNIGIVGIAALTGFIALVIIMVALLAGLWLDSLIGQRGPATVCLLVLSVPVSLYVMVRIALMLVRHIEISVPNSHVEGSHTLSDEKED